LRAIGHRVGPERYDIEVVVIADDVAKLNTSMATAAIAR